MIDPIFVWLAAAALCLLALASYLRHGGALRLEVAVTLGMFGIAAVALWFRDRLMWAPGLADGVALSVLLVHAYTLVRVVGRQRPVPRVVHLMALLGLVVGLGAVLVAPYPRPVPVTVGWALYFIAAAGYAAVALANEARAAPGLRRRRLAIAATGPFLLGSGVFIALLRDVVPGLAPWVGPWVYPLALAALVGFYLGFLTPTWLRQAWQMREVRRLLETVARLKIETRLNGNTRLLCHAAMSAVGGSDARLVVRENGGWRVVTPRGEENGGDHALERVEALMATPRPLALSPGTQLGPEAAAWATALGARRILVVPVASTERRWGILLVALRDVPLFLEDDLDLVELLCDQIAMRLDADAFLHAQKRLLKQIESANEELEQFAVVVSHDLQEPLRMVTSYIDLVVRRYADALDADARAFLGYAAEGTDRMKQLIRDLLAYARARTESLEVKSVNLEEVLDRVRADLRKAIEEGGVQITNDPLPTVQAFEVQMVQLLQNLVGNALKFADEAPLRVHVSATERAGDWELAVRDNGVGIDPKYAEQIFGVFQRVPGKDVPGTGIGLAICRRIVERHGGHIWAEAAKGGGTVIRFTLAKQPLEESVEIKATVPPPLDGAEPPSLH